MMGNYYGDDSPSQLLMRTQEIHDDMMAIYNEQVRALQIKVALLEDENQKLKERLSTHGS